jgi:hypothetical protein
MSETCQNPVRIVHVSILLMANGTGEKRVVNPVCRYGGFSMLNRVATIGLFLSSAVAFAQAGTGGTIAPSLDAPTTLPIVFTNTISAGHSHTGDPVMAKTSQIVHLPNGTVIPSGSKILGHVVSANRFVYDETPYAHQKQSTLSLKFDSVQIAGASVPLNVTVRAIADPVTSEEARTPTMPHDADPQGTMTQIGGDQLTPSQAKVYSDDGDVVAYNKRGGVYAHLIANNGCDASSVEVSVGIYSASACGVYGFASVSAQERGSEANPSNLTLVSTHLSPKIWKNSTALLEVLPENRQTVASR